MKYSRPEKIEYAEYYSNYVSLVTEDDILAVLENQENELNEILSQFPEEKGDYCYAEGKWSIKELLGHMADTERVFEYRMLCFSRNDKTSLPGFEQDDYVSEGAFSERSVKSLTDEIKTIRESLLSLVKSLTDEQWLRGGTANAKNMSVRALAFVIAGHFRHHLNVLKAKYL